MTASYVVAAENVKMNYAFFLPPKSSVESSTMCPYHHVVSVGEQHAAGRVTAQSRMFCLGYTRFAEVSGFGDLEHVRVQCGVGPWG